MTWMSFTVEWVPLSHWSYPVLTIKYELQKGAKNVLGNDVLSVREAVTNWLNKAYPTHSPLDISSWGNCGIKHETTGWLLCPIEYDWTDERWAIFMSCFESILNHAQSVRAKLHDCSLDEGFDFAKNFFVCCFYVDYKGNPENVKKGFLRSTLFVQVYF